jgi:hypothetical protein
MSLGLGTSLLKGGLTTPGIVTDSLVLKHNYAAGGVVPVSDGAADINADAAANEYIDVGTIEITTNDVSVCAWVYITSFVDLAAIISNRHASGDYQGFALRIDSGNPRFELIMDEVTTGSVSSVTSADKNTNQWYHVCGVFDRSGSQYLYVDGVLEDSDSIAGLADSLTHTTNVTLGKRFDATYMRGYMCNVGYWNGALTQAQIKSIMWKNYAGLTSSDKDAGATGSSNIVAWWDLDSEVGSDGNAGSGYVLNEVAGAGSTTNLGTLT